MAARAPRPSPARSWRWRWPSGSLREYGVLKTNPLRDYVAATSVGIVRGVPMLDLCYEEDSQADVDMNVVMTGARQVRRSAGHRRTRGRSTTRRWRR